MTNLHTDIAVLILNWNQSDISIKCIESIIVNVPINTQIFLLDNGSSLSEYQKLTAIYSKHARVNVYRSEVNLGFTGGNNYLIQQVQQQNKFGYFLLLNNDTEVTPNFLEPLIKVFEVYPKVGSVSPLIIKYFDRQKIDSCGAHGYKWLAQPFASQEGQHISKALKKNTKVQFNHGCAVLLSEEVLDKVGMLDNTFFAYFEDFDLGLRIKYAGFLNYVEPKSVIYHYGSASTQKAPSFLRQLSTRNRVYFARKHNSSLIVWFIFIPYFFIWKFCLQTLKLSNKNEVWKDLWQGFKKGWKLTPSA